MPRCYRVFSPEQAAYLRQHYRTLPPAHFAQRWGVSVRQVYELAQRHGITKRAPNGQPAWRARRPAPAPPTPQPAVFA